MTQLPCIIYGGMLWTVSPQQFYGRNGGIILIEVKNLTKRYGDNEAVKSISFKIVNGKIYGLLGPNGAGKSTTMNMMTGCLSPTSGTVNINGFDIYENPVEAKKCIGYLPEQPPLYTEMTPEEYLTFVAEAKGVPHNRVHKQVSEVMALTGIEDRKDRLIRNLSKGYKQRVGIAQAMLGNPEIIILDEPTVGLDPKQIMDIRDLIRHLGHSRTVIISSHILTEISEICDEILVISSGRLIASGTQEELQAKLGTGKVLHLVVRGDEQGIRDVLSAIEGVGEVRTVSYPQEGEVELHVSVESDDLRDNIFFAMAERRYAVLTMELEEQTLESIFLSLTDSAPAQTSAPTSESNDEREDDEDDDEDENEDEADEDDEDEEDETV